MDPFDVLGVPRDATPHEIRTAWRQLSKKCHPDAGGDTQQMIRLNEALAEALDALSNFSVGTVNNTRPSSRHKRTQDKKTHRVRHDVSSFTFNVLPVESFELLEIVASTFGSVIESDCPYLMEFSLENLGDAFASTDWCRCELVPEAGGTMVHLTVGGLVSGNILDIEGLRDELIRHINEIGEINLVEPKPS